MSEKLYQLYCDCGYRRITDGTDIQDLKEFKRPDIQKNLPIQDRETKKITKGTWKKQPKMFKCPKCGKLMKPVKIKPTEHEAPKEAADEDINSGS